MRTTVTISDDIDARLRSVARERRLSYKDVINEALRSGLDRLEAREPASDYVVETSDYGFQPGIDHTKLNQLFDELESNRDHS